MQKWACYALSVLSNWRELRAPICDAGGRHALVDAIKTHKDKSKEHSKEFLQYAGLAMQRLQ
jgi:hypothetical protein